MNLNPDSRHAFFVCEQCSTLDSTQLVARFQGAYLCTQCRTGAWHNHFPKRHYQPGDIVINRPSQDTESVSFS